MRGQKSEVGCRNFQWLEICASVFSNHWKVAAACVLIAINPSCSPKNQSATTGSLTSEQRIEAVLPVLGPLHGMSKAEALAEFKRSTDAEYFLRQAETQAAAWSRSTIKRPLSDGENLLVCCIIAGETVEGLRAKLVKDGRTVLSTNEISDLYKLVDEEAAKRGLQRTAKGLDWKK